MDNHRAVYLKVIMPQSSPDDGTVPTSKTTARHDGEASDVEEFGTLTVLLGRDAADDDD